MNDDSWNALLDFLPIEDHLIDRIPRGRKNGERRLFPFHANSDLSLSAPALYTHRAKTSKGSKTTLQARNFSAARLEKKSTHTQGLRKPGAGGGPLRVTWGRQQGGQGRTLWQRHHFDTHCPKSRGSSVYRYVSFWNLVSWLDSVKRVTPLS